MEYVRLRCAHCKVVYKVKSHLAGKKVKCASCQQILVVPLPASREELTDEHTLGGVQAAADSKSTSSYGVAEAASAPEKVGRKGASDKSDDEESTAVRPSRRARASRRALKAAWKKVRLGLFFLAMATTITLLTGLSSLVLGRVLPLSALLVLHNIQYPMLLLSQALQICGFSLVLFVPARIPKHLTAGVLATCLAISVIGELLTLWTWISLGPADNSQKALDKQTQLMQELQDTNPEVRAKAREELSQVNKNLIEESEKMTSRLGTYVLAHV